MELLPHNLSSEFARMSNVAKGLEPEAGPLIAFRDAQQLSLLVRATAFVFADPRSRELHHLIERIAPSESTVLITGETGTGKELVARHVHALSNRADASFVAINCGAFAESLVESELFGYERGAFTGAQQGKPGWFETANGGTLFLDEIGDLPMPMQVKLLRVLQEREVVRLGARKPIPIDVRLIAATNVDLGEAVRAGRFREDLFYRLQVVSLPLRPLRERKGDIPPLAHHFVKMYVERMHLQKGELSPAAEQALLAYPWPGNIRELENIIHRALLVSQNGVIQPVDLHLPDWHVDKSSLAFSNFESVTASPYVENAGSLMTPTELAPIEPELDYLTQFRQAWRKLLESNEAIQFDSLQHELVLDAWEHNRRNQVRAAQHLNISRNILRTFLKKAGVL